MIARDKSPDVVEICDGETAEDSPALRGRLYNEGTEAKVKHTRHNG